MKLRLKKAIDQYVGLPALVGLNLVALGLGLVLRRSHSTGPVRTVVVTKFQGMGSLILAKPAFHSLRKSYPDARLIFWGTPSTCVLARLMPEFDEVLTLDDSGLVRSALSIARGIVRLMRRRVDWTFDLEVYSKLSSILATLTCARNRAGFAVDSVRARRWSHTHLLFFNRYEFLGHAYWRLLGLVSPGAEQAENDYGKWKAPLTRLPELPSRYMVVNMHVGELSPERKWPKVYLEKTIHALLDQDDGLHAVLIGKGASEAEECRAFAPHPRLLDISDTLTLEETLRCVANAALVLTADTAALHFALGTGAPVVGLFGPTRPETYVDASRANTITLTRRYACSPCVHHWYPPPCGGDNQCMKTLPVRDVLRACATLLSIPTPEVSLDELPSLANPDYYPGLVYQRGIGPGPG